MTVVEIEIEEEGIESGVEIFVEVDDGAETCREVISNSTPLFAAEVEDGEVLEYTVGWIDGWIAVFFGLVGGVLALPIMSDERS